MGKTLFVIAVAVTIAAVGVAPASADPAGGGSNTENIYSCADNDTGCQRATIVGAQGPSPEQMSQALQQAFSQRQAEQGQPQPAPPPGQ
jgi:hypothetical protein